MALPFFVNRHIVTRSDSEKLFAPRHYRINLGSRRTR